MNIKAVILVILGFSIISFVAGAYFASPGKSSGFDRVKTTQKTGAAISVSDWDTKGDSFRFTTTALGTGSAVTEAPKTIIPEARAYIEDVNTVNILAGTLFYDRRLDPFLGAEYMRRMGNASFGGGALGSRGGVAGAWFKAGCAF